VTLYGVVVAPFTLTARSAYAGRTQAAEASVMPTTTTLLLFVASTLALLAVPGPSVVYVVTRTLEQGRRAGLVSMLGLETGALAHVALSALGVTALLAASDWAVVVVKYAGVTYLVVLGVRQLRRGAVPASQTSDAPGTSYARLFRDGVMVDLLNPKTGLFFLAFLPQFVEQGRGPVAVQALVLGVCFVALAVVTDGAYALVTSAVCQRGARRRSTSRRPVVRRASGAVYCVLGGVTALA
jgi:threonine/homoserine/homoserine lactone efflux protein